MTSTNTPAVKKNFSDPLWYDMFTAVLITKENLKDVAGFLEGKVEGDDIVCVPSARGEFIVRVGDHIAVDQVGKIHCVRMTIADSVEKLSDVRQELRSRRYRKNDK